MYQISLSKTLVLSFVISEEKNQDVYKRQVVDEETGKEKKVKKNGFVVSPADISGYARFFEKYTQDEDRCV